jgi:hypothetical protein
MIRNSEGIRASGFGNMVLRHFKIFFPNLYGGSDESHETPSLIADKPTEIHTSTSMPRFDLS